MTGQAVPNRGIRHTVKFGPDGVYGALSFGLTATGLMTIRLYLPDGRTSPIAFLSRDDADLLIAAWDGDRTFQVEVNIDMDDHGPRGKMKMLTCVRDARRVSIGLSPAVDDMETEEWGFEIPLKMADALMQQMHPMIRFGAEG